MDQPIVFSGYYEDTKETDCLLLFDGKKFTLERVSGAVRSLRPLRAAKQPVPAKRAPSPTPAAPKGKRVHSGEAKQLSELGSMLLQSLDKEEDDQ